MYYVLLLQKWHHVMILIRTNHPRLRVRHHRSTQHRSTVPLPSTPSSPLVSVLDAGALPSACSTSVASSSYNTMLVPVLWRSYDRSSSSSERCPLLLHCPSSRGPSSSSAFGHRAWLLLPNATSMSVPSMPAPFLRPTRAHSSSVPALMPRSPPRPPPCRHRLHIVASPMPVVVASQLVGPTHLSLSL
jgi:hypothetical protein